MVIEFAWFVWGLVAAFVGAELFVRSAGSIAVRLGIPPVVIGLTVVAWGTSSPELAVSLRAALGAEGPVALGNVVGSNIFNVGVILGLSALVHPMRVVFTLVRIDTPILLGVTLLFCGLFFGQSLSRMDGTILFATFIAYSYVTLRGARQDIPPEVEEEFRREEPRFGSQRWLAVSGLAVGLVPLLHGGQVLVEQAIVLAREIGVSERVIGLTIVAAGTSSPELLTSLVAATHRHSDIAVGNIIGSNIFNLAAVLGASSLVSPIASGGLAPLDLAALIISAVVLLPIMRSGFVIERWEGMLLIGAYAAYLLALFF